MVVLSQMVLINGFLFRPGAKLDPVLGRLESVNGDVTVYLRPRKVNLVLSQQRSQLRRGPGAVVEGLEGFRLELPGLKASTET